MDHVNSGAIMNTARPEISASYRFAAGKMVRLKSGFPLRNAVPGLYEVLAQLPERDGERQYRIKSDREPYQRIVKEDDLEPA
jgi:hypothetical protein